jgi:outer membrane protein OmpA-like peptidoglycan-associated protein
MLKNLLFISAVAAFTIANASASETGAKGRLTPGPVLSQEKSFNVFFDADEASLTPEGRAIISAAAKRFMDDHASNARVFVVTSSDASDENLPAERAKVVKSELERDGVKAEAISAVQHSQNVPASLQAWQNNRILIALGANSAFAKATN